MSYLDHIESTDNIQLMIHYLKEKAKQQKRKRKRKRKKISNISSESIATEIPGKEEESFTRFYELKKLEINHCYVHFKKYGWNGVFRKMPNLKTIILSRINSEKMDDNLYYGRNFVKQSIKQPTFDLSHLSLNLLRINDFNYDPHVINKTHKNHYIKELMIDKISLDKVYYVGLGNTTRNVPFGCSRSATLNIKCKYIDYLDFYNC
ncbi:unnamed protein product [Cunninghamella blakesleeana]